MRAVVCDRFEGMDALRVGELPEPDAGPGTVLVGIEAAAVNSADTLMVAGTYQIRPDTPFAPGHEVAGRVAASNQATGFSSGDRACGLLGHGGMAERGVLHETNCVHLPDHISYEVGASIPVAYGTPCHTLVDRGHLAEDERLLVLGAAGGVGMAAVQVGKAPSARVIAAVSSESKAAAVRKAGADKVIRYDATPLRDGIDEATDREGVDLVYDPVGGDLTELALRWTRWNGRVLVIGFAGGPIPKIPLDLPLVRATPSSGCSGGDSLPSSPKDMRRTSHRSSSGSRAGPWCPG